MNTFKGTRGPWSDEGCYASDAGWELDYDSDSEAGRNGGCSSKTVHANGTPVAIVMVPAPWGLDHICDANARLISAAPCLLEACQALLDLVDIYPDMDAGDPEETAIGFARSAISKALGEG